MFIITLDSIYDSFVALLLLFDEELQYFSILGAKDSRCINWNSMLRVQQIYFFLRFNP